ncbi:MAG: prenyltransferase/squalene oxidase repeat-containing protein [Ginsengibacter sp.]
MINLGNFKNIEFVNEKLSLKKNFYKYKKESIQLPSFLDELIFKEPFFTGEQYLFFPFYFRKAFSDPPVEFVNKLCISGYLYFRYLLCMDNLIDNDNSEQDKQFAPASLLVLRAHVYHEESIKILSSLFGSKSPFWKAWKKRNHQFYNSILIDKKYDPEMEFSVYTDLSAGKCSFLKATIDAYYNEGTAKDKMLYEALKASFDLFSAGRCLQDDLEDFKKDLVHKKNNYGHVMFNQWCRKTGQQFDVNEPATMEKYFFSSKVAEEMMERSKMCFNLAIDAVDGFGEILPEYIRHLEAFRNKSIQVKVNIEAYRVTKLIEKIKSPVRLNHDSIAHSIASAAAYLKKMQNAEGSWQDVSNKQGLSDIWATGYIAMNLSPSDPAFRRAAHFLNTNRQFGSWAYNKDWVPDFDSVTCSLSVLSKANYTIADCLETWFEGQTSSGGFSTYRPADKLLQSYLGHENNQCVKEWSKEHICVSALAYYFLSGFNEKQLYKTALKNLKGFLLNAVTKDGIWEPYWWTSVIYPTTYIIKGMLKEKNETDRKIIDKAIKSLLARQGRDGSFSCDLLNTKNVFYTSLILDTLCSDGELSVRYGKQIEKMKNWILGKQYEDGSFENSNFMVLPYLPSASRKTGTTYKIDHASGTGSVTGEIAGLFSTVSAYKALTNYKLITPQL